MKIPKDIIALHPSTVASIHAQWLRETKFDGKFLKGWGTENPDTAGGNATHTHSSNAHAHGLNAHSHTYRLYHCPATNQGADEGYNSSWDYHTHNGTSGAVGSETTTSDALTYGEMSNNPPYLEFIFVKANYGALLHDGLCFFWAGFGGNTDIPNLWQECNGNNGSPDGRGKYIRGAGTDQNAGAFGGATQNVHDISHTHTAQNHTHIEATSGGPNESGGAGSTERNRPPHSHTHQVSMNGSAQGLNAFAGNLTPSEVVEPAHKKLCLIQYKTGALKPKGIIALTLLTEAEIATKLKGWVLCDGNNGTENLKDYHIKVADDKTQIGNVGGSNTHGHAEQAHAHTANGSHTHTGNSSAHTLADYDIAGYSAGSKHVLNSAAYHTIDTVSSSTVDYANANTTANSSSNEPEYRTALFVQYQKAVAGGITSFL